MEKIQPYSQGKSGETNQYVRCVRPMTGKLLRGLGLDVSYARGEGDWLWTNETPTRQVLDLTGGYGANLLGHSHPRLTKKATDLIAQQVPNMTQGSIRTEAGKLAGKIEKLMAQETGKNRWVTHFSNSGTESVEAALKFCQLHFAKTLEKFRQQIVLNKNTLQYKLSHGLFSVQEEGDLHKKLIFLTEKTGSTEELLHLHFENCLKKLEVEAVMGSFEKAFHGKTLGSLTLNGNSKFQSGFGSHLESLCVKQTSAALKEAFDLQRISFILIDEKTLRSREVEFSKIAGFFVEPIQGEGGIYEIDPSLLKSLKEQTAQSESTLLVSDEIQAGLFRTGKMASLSHSSLAADLYCFSKALGGGLAKIAATVINSRVYKEEFGLLHTSTFAEDAFSSSMASEVLEILEDRDLVERAMARAKELKNKLQELAALYPDVIAEVRGRGYMIGVEFHSSVAENSYEDKLFSDPSMTGHLLSAVLLHQEHVRVAPSLSNDLTLRIEPSLFFTEEMCEKTLNSFEKLCQAISEQNSHYLYGPLFNGDEEKIRPGHRIDKKKVHTRKSEKPLAVFLCHLIDPDHSRLFLNSVKEIPSDVLENKIYDFSLIQDFSVYYRDTLKGENNREIDVAMMSLPLTSQDIMNFTKKNKRSEIVSKIQRAIEYAKELGATTVGLGQFTSIVTKSGLALDSLGMNLTTGNALTVKMGVDAALRECQLKGLDESQLNISAVGCAGNITSVVSTMLADHCRKMTLIHRTSVYKSPKFQETLVQMLNEIRESSSDAPCAAGIRDLLRREAYRPERDLYEILNDARFCEFIEIQESLDSLKNADLVICGTNSPQAFIGPEHISPNTVIVDISVPRNVQNRVEEIPGVSLLLGGVASLPKRDDQLQAIDTPIFPMEKGECFACMGETFTLGLAGTSGAQNTGGLSKSSVEHMATLAESVGIRLGGAKRMSSL